MALFTNLEEVQRETEPKFDFTIFFKYGGSSDGISSVPLRFTEGFAVAHLKMTRNVRSIKPILRSD